MVSVSVNKLRKHYGQVVAVNDVSFEVKAGELFFLLGPSGCGKTTILRAIAGFCDLDQGEIYFDERRVDALPPYKRNTGMVFQNYALWPHLTVGENVQYGLDVRRLSRDEKRSRVNSALEMVRMRDAAGRKPAELSGGQQQRVALARALVIEPDVILLDEPLSNLDARLRAEMRDEIKRIHRALGISMVYVTHDQKEALCLADRLAVMSAGRIEQTGSPREIYETPGNTFVAEFIGETNLVPGKVADCSAEGVVVDTAIGSVRSHDTRSKLSVGQEVTCCIRPEAIAIRPSQSGVNCFQGRLESVTYLGDLEQYTLRLGAINLKAVAVNPPPEGTKRRATTWLSCAPEDVIILTV